MPKAGKLEKIVRQICEQAVPPTDAVLWDRFVQSRDQDAFEVLVHRHGPMVLACAYRILSERSDAEDVFQATFLSLAQARNRLRDPGTLASWLYKVANRAANKMRKKRRPVQSYPEIAVAPSDTEADVTWREVKGMLDEEIQRLPERLRSPLLLCYLSGYSRDEAAKKLGCSFTLLKRRLEEARKILRSRLERRGISTAGLALAVLSPQALQATVPITLIETCLRYVFAADVAIPVAVAGLTYPTFVITKGLVVKTLTAALLCVGFGIVWSSNSGASKGDERSPTIEQSKAPAKAEIQEPKTDPQEPKLKGQVLNSDGKPIAAELFFVGKNKEFVSLGSAKTDGTFEVAIPKTEFGGWLVARANGLSVDFQEIDEMKLSTVSLKLQKEYTLRGRLIDPKGQPVAGATVTVYNLLLFKNNSIESYLKDRRNSTNLRNIENEKWMFDHTLKLLVATTDAEGRYEIHGVGAEQLVGLQIHGSGRAKTEAYVVTRTGFDPEPYKVVSFNLMQLKNGGQLYWAPDPILHGPDENLTVEPEKPIRGKILDAKTGKPRPGIVVTTTVQGGMDITATTDSNGCYEIHGSMKLPTYFIKTPMDTTVGYLAGCTEVQDTPDYEPIVADIRSDKGIIVTGKLKDKSTGKPLQGSFGVYELKDNNFAKNYPSLGTFGQGNKERTASDGAFRLVVIPGPVLLYVRLDWLEIAKYQSAQPVPNYVRKEQDGLLWFEIFSGEGLGIDMNWCKVLNAKETDTVIEQDIELELASRKTVKIVDAENRPVLNAEAVGYSNIAFSAPYPLKDSDTLNVYRLEPKEQRLVAVVQNQRKLVGALTVKETDKDPIVKLGPGGTATGQVLDKEGKPIEGVNVILNYSQKMVSSHFENKSPLYIQGPEAITDAKGAFRFETIFPDQEFSLWFVKGKTQYSSIDKSPLKLQSIKKQGDLLDLGEIKVEPKPRSDGPVKEPPAAPPKP